MIVHAWNIEIRFSTENGIVACMQNDWHRSWYIIF